MSFLITMICWMPSYEDPKESIVVKYINSTFNNTKDMLIVFNYAIDNIYDHHLDDGIWRPPLKDIFFVQKWNEMYNYCDLNFSTLDKFANITHQTHSTIFGDPDYRSSRYYGYDPINENKKKWSKIVINTYYSEQEYIDYFSLNDYQLNGLRSILVDLIKDLPNLYRRKIDEREDTDQLIECNHLLQKYCLQLIERCQQYVEQINTTNVSLSF
ncbi:hypothetical protein TVAG_374720 [Trichomonas vaginalis G3]|uniref:Uncharacterized protein n=1 Tax=Trichomonas vaginalis (strain ATCC PRA-98 / G3) TaxID=412133 RepID=A2FCI5_TRIV3|nr:hypothetical protein TVAGG3_0151460 [Trichomonas vaginalis G3]EAX97391.1 hypothetical protein TVAG_374720 [Trichomonas vaginalis G3]KAI5547295.1 hypothetical protein TVAGG3_0151460 [Trichomonas vaginalis G3]|eukprot:XP_001310321.1 hypothetical protein [Trichomonas vaginalis G3]